MTKKSAELKKYTRTLAVLLVFVMIAMQATRIVRLGNVKSGFHVDEMLTYTLSNYPDTFVKDTEGLFENWVSGDVYEKTLSVATENRFDYKMVTNNQSKDVHPPLYYYIIHTVASMVPGTFSKWIGIIPNLIFAVFTTILFYGINRKIFKNELAAVFCTAVWTFSIAAMNGAIFIRMYTILTFFAVLLARIHLKALDEIKEAGCISKKTYGCFFLCTCMGILTHYYYMIFCFFLCGIFFFYLLRRKNWKQQISYCLAEGGAILAAILCYPTMLTHIFSGYRGKQAMESLNNFQGMKESVKTALSIIDGQLFNRQGEKIIVIMLILAIVLFVLKKLNKGKEKESLSICRESELETTFIVAASAVVAVGYVTVIAKIAPYVTDRYFLCVFPLIVLSVVYTASVLVSKLVKREVAVLVVLAFLLLTSRSRTTQHLNYLYGHYDQRIASLEPYHGASAVILNGEYGSAPDEWLWECGNYDMIYRCSGGGKYEGLKTAVETKDLSEGFLIYAHGIYEPDEVVRKIVEKQIKITSFEKVTDIGCRVYFCTIE